MSRFRVCESEWMPLNAEYAIDGVNEEEAICGGLITKVSAKKVALLPGARPDLSFTRGGRVGFAGGGLF